MFMTLYRSVPSTAVGPANGGTVWACGSIQTQLESPGSIWMEILVYRDKGAPYVTSEDGPALGLGYLPEEDWYSFPVECLVRWRRYGESKWENGPGHSRHISTFRKWETERKNQRAEARSRMVHDGVDWERILANEGLGLID